MSAVTTMTFGRPVRFDALTFASSALDALLSAPARLDAWLERRDQARMTVSDVLAFARSVEASDPGFAADLRGAALRAGE